MNEPKNQDKIDTPTRQTIGSEVFAYWLRENHAELQNLRTLVGDVLANQQQTAKAVQLFLSGHERVVRKVGELNRRQKALERVVYEGATPPKMQGPPGGRRPILPSAPDHDPEDSWNTGMPPELVETLQRLHVTDVERKKRNSFIRKEILRTAIKWAAIAVVAAGGYVWAISHGAASPPAASEVRK